MLYNSSFFHRARRPFVFNTQFRFSFSVFFALLYPVFLFSCFISPFELYYKQNLIRGGSSYEILNC